MTTNPPNQGGGGMWILNQGWGGVQLKGEKKKVTPAILMAEVVSDMTLDSSTRVWDVC